MNSKVEVSARRVKPPLKGCRVRPTSIIRFHSRVWIPQVCLLGFAVIFFGIGAAGQHSSSQASEPIATLDGQPILEDELPGPVRIQLQKIHRQEDQLKSSGLEALLEKRLLDAEAKKKGLSVTDLTGDFCTRCSEREFHLGGPVMAMRNLLRKIEVGIANGKPTPQACKEAEITVQTYYRWRKNTAG
jgi:SurA-like N-terminal domain